MEEHHQAYRGLINVKEIMMGWRMHINDLPGLRGYIYGGGENVSIDWCLGIFSVVRHGRCQFSHATTE